MDPALQARAYFKACKKIDEKYDTKLRNFIIQVTDDNASEKMHAAEHKLKTYTQDMCNQKSIALFTLKTKCNIDDVLWENCLDIQDALQEFDIKNRLIHGVDAVHDPKIPQWFLFMLKKQLVKEGFNPARIDLCSLEGVSANVQGTSIIWSLVEENLSMERKDFGSIGINCKELQPHSLDLEKGRCLLLVEQLQGCRNLNLCEIVEAVGVKVPRKESDTLRALEAIRSLYTIALKNPRNAHCIKAYCRSIWSKKNYSVEHYKQLSAIDFHWKTLAWLKKYFSYNYHCISLFLKAKDGDVSFVSNMLCRGMVVTKAIVDEVKKNQSESPISGLVQQAYDNQQCCVCWEHPEDMRDMPCSGEHVKEFICRVCYNGLKEDKLKQKICPLCKLGLFPYNQVCI